MKQVVLVSFLVLSCLLAVGGLYGLVKSQSGSQTTQVLGNSTTTDSPTQAASFTLVDVAKHASPTDCWMVIEGRVYDVTSYVNRHPGGSGEMSKGCGIDATSLYNARPTQNNTPHPPKADMISAQYKVGTVKN